MSKHDALFDGAETVGAVFAFAFEVIVEDCDSGLFLYQVSI
jgi:hypothetical protein